MSVAIMVLAAGESRRMGGQDKLLTQIGGVPLLRRVCERAAMVSEHVIVTLPPDHPRQSVLNGLSVTKATVAKPGDGMSVSIIAGLDKVPKAADGVMILPADMPDLTATDLRAVIQRFENTSEITRGCSADGHPGHPVVFPRKTFPDLRNLKGDMGARLLLKDRPIQYVLLPERHALTDLDTPEDWQEWFRSSGRDFK